MSKKFKMLLFDDDDLYGSEEELQWEIMFYACPEKLIVCSSDKKNLEGGELE